MPRHLTRTGDATTTRGVASLWAALLMMIMVASCSDAGPPAPPETARELSWSRIALPESVAASSLAPAPEVLLVAGRASSGRGHPALFAVDASGNTHAVALHPNSPYAMVADLVSVAAHGTEVVALGGKHGGAHANVRWTVWTGSRQGLDEYPQPFETFGGQSAGGLLGIVIASDGPVIAGTWAANEGGLNAAVWLPTGRRWLRQESDGTALANTQQIQVNPRAASAAGPAVILSGSVITFGDGVEQRAALWTWPTRSSAWMLQQLPDAGIHSEALSSRCVQTCWVSGHADGRLALWSFDLAHVAESATRDSTLPSMEINTDGPGPRTVISGGQPGILFSHADSTRLLVSDGHNGWQTFTAPAGSVLDATTVGDRLYAIIRTDDTAGLWTADLAATRTR
ncbi:MAG TPA: hypothetical protein VK754_03920 [Propionibacteriaceae bacterium]|nr:hypothetical protein [Propionibacteriaceae bacterium]